MVPFLFFYPGLPVGANPKRCATWDTLIDQLRKRLRSWGNRYVSLGGGLSSLIRCSMQFPFFIYRSWSCRRRCWRKLLEFKENSCGVELGVVGRCVGWVGRRCVSREVKVVLEWEMLARLTLVSWQNGYEGSFKIIMRCGRTCWLRNMVP
jgi:hypothetical protein